MLTTHPIQYQVPWFRLLAEDPSIDFEVLYCMIPDAETQGDGFGVAFEWDIPLLDGYRYRVLENVASEPSITRFSGCDTPGIRDIVRGVVSDVLPSGWMPGDDSFYCNPTGQFIIGKEALALTLAVGPN